MGPNEFSVVSKLLNLVLNACVPAPCITDAEKYTFAGLDLYGLSKSNCRNVG